MINSALGDLARFRNYSAGRSSSWDRSGGNGDYFIIKPGETRSLAEIEGPGCIRHIWTTIACGEVDFLRKLVLRIWWDGESDPSVECPVGDFFGLGHAQTTYFSSAPFDMFERGFNCWFPMPFSSGARIEVTNECSDEEKGVAVYYFYIDYDVLSEPQTDMGRFHTQWRRENPTTAVQLPDRKNLDGKENYIMMEAFGRGHYVGCHLNIDAEVPGWWGEGDDMFFIDGATWPPTLHGTGTEDYFCGAWNYNLLKQTFCTPYLGYHFKTNADYTGKHSMYRYHILDPIPFKEHLFFSIEHGHANNRSHDYSSTCYWYQEEPHRHVVDLLPVNQRLPRAWGGIHM